MHDLPVLSRDSPSEERAPSGSGAGTRRPGPSPGRPMPVGAPAGIPAEDPGRGSRQRVPAVDSGRDPGGESWWWIPVANPGGGSRRWIPAEDPGGGSRRRIPVVDPGGDPGGQPGGGPQVGLADRPGGPPPSLGARPPAARGRPPSRRSTRTNRDLVANRGEPRLLSVDHGSLGSLGRLDAASPGATPVAHFISQSAPHPGKT